MTFGGKNRKATGKRPSIPHHPRARWRRYAKRCTWDRVEITLNGEPLTEVSEISFETMRPPELVGGFTAFEVILKAGEEACSRLMLGITRTMGIDASMASRLVFGGNPAAYCTAAVALPDTGPDLKALVCTLPAGHADWHLDVTGARWRIDHGNLIVQPVAIPEVITTEVRVDR